MAASGAAILDREGVGRAERRLSAGLDARYEGQTFEVHVGLDGMALEGDRAGLDAEFARRFRAAHAAIYGYDIPGRAIEIVTVRLKATGAVANPQAGGPAGESGGAAAIGRRAVYFAAGWVDTPVYRRAGLSAGSLIAGPAVVEEMSATTLLHPGQQAGVDAAGNLIVTA
jgi:N-methylhydantoinase A